MIVFLPIGIEHFGDRIEDAGGIVQLAFTTYDTALPGLRRTGEVGGQYNFRAGDALLFYRSQRQIKISQLVGRYRQPDFGKIGGIDMGEFFTSLNGLT